MSAPIEESFIEIDGLRIFLRRRNAGGEGPPTIFVHGNPTHSADWLPFLAAIDGPAVALDLPGFGRSSRPDPARFAYSISAYAELLDRAFAELAPDGYRLVVHDWGVLGLVAAQIRSQEVQRLVVMNAVPLTGTYRWHWLARLWRRRGAGEAFNALNSRFATGALLRLARPGRRPMPPEFVDLVWDAWDPGTSRAVLALYRSADPDALEAAGGDLGRVDCPALVLWGRDDPYIGPADGRFYERRLPHARFVEVERAGHWPWIDRPDVVGVVISFLEDRQAGSS